MALSFAATQPSMSLKINRHRITQAVVSTLYVFATLQFIRFYTISTTFYLNLRAYLTGHERMPFQKRVLPALIINILHSLPFASHVHFHSQGSFSANKAPIFVLALISIFIAGYFTQRLYGLLTTDHSLYFLVYPIFLFALLWAYAMHMEANYSYPYDMPSVAIFSAGLYFIYARKFWAVVLVIAIGTLNRETTLFLIGIYVLDSMNAVVPKDLRLSGLKLRIRSIPWLRVALLVAIWVAIELTLNHIFAANSRAEDYVRLRENAGRLKLRLLPALLNICGYMLPIVLLLQSRIHPFRFRTYLLIVPVWFAIMFYTGVIVETRIYGELCPYVAVALVLIIERSIQGRASDRVIASPWAT